MKALLSFLTIIPVREKFNLKDVACGIHIFPLIGVLTGALTGLVAYCTSKIFPEPLTGIITVSFLEVITGIHHLDALLDFGDGVLAKTSPEEKIRVMHDKCVGAGGFWLGITIIGIKVLSIMYLHEVQLFTLIIVSEVSAKLSMVISMWVGKPAYQSSTATPFIEEAHRKRWKPTLALVVSLAIALLCSIKCIFMICVGIVVALFITWIAYRNFRGVTGDVLGAIDEVASATTLLVAVI